MIRRVYERCVQSGFDTYVATDSRRVAHEIPYEHVIYDNTYYDCGTSRIVGAVKLKNLKYDRIINVQGDMPDVTVEMIHKVNEYLTHWNITTAYTDMPSEIQNDPNSVKMVRSGDKSLWFGRGMVGYGDWHLGIYGYRNSTLQLYSSYGIELEEEIEKLEQLRWLKAGWDIGCVYVDFDGIEINTPQDMEKWNESR